MPEVEDPCPICLCRKQCTVSTPCKHTFCKQCLERMYLVCSLKACPLCRAPFEYYIRETRTITKIVFLA